MEMNCPGGPSIKLGQDAIIRISKSETAAPQKTAETRLENNDQWVEKQVAAQHTMRSLDVLRRVSNPGAFQRFLQMYAPKSRQ
eukprot:1258857-Amphidinium_carterae.1